MSNEAKQGSKVWFVTGASTGFGRAIVEEALSRGDSVVAVARRREPLEALAATAPGRVLPLSVDVTNETSVRDAVAAALDRFGRIDVVVNNAGFSIVGALEETSDAELRATMELMFFGPVNVMRAVLPSMRAQRSGTIVQMSSVGGVITAPGFGPYCAAKHALEAVSESLASEVAPHGVRVLIVEPGSFRTELFGSAFRTMPKSEAYEATVGPTRAYVAESAGKQPGDPKKAARAIADAVASDTHPLRLPLGGDAIEGVRAKLAQVGADVNATESVARATSFDA